MTEQVLHDQVQKMMSIINQIPIGLIEADIEGNILQMNAKSVQLLMPLFFSNDLQGNNIHALLAITTPDLLAMIQQYDAPLGCITNQSRREVVSNNHQGTSVLRHFLFTVNKLDKESVMYIFDDITELYIKEKEVNQLLLEKAVEQSKFETASGVLHDIGNAVVGFTSYITKIRRGVEQNDIKTLENLKRFIEKNVSAFSDAIGEQKANAMLELLGGIIINQEEKLDDIKLSISEQMKVLSHIQEVLNIQRQYVKGQSSEREPVNIRSVLNDAISMFFGNLDKKDIAFNFDVTAAIPKINGDRTKLMQVFLNLLKNAVDAVEAIDSTEKRITVYIGTDDSVITVQIIDNGRGFDHETAANLFKRGYTTKSEGTGLGLVNCKSIIEAHNGEITLTSNGKGKGATATLLFRI
jgi:signal transduction histidine kinase